MSATPSQKKNIVVVGGGYGGIKVARALSEPGKLDASKYHVILINDRPDTVSRIAGLRMAVTSDGGLENTALIPFDKLFVQEGVGSFKVGSVVSVRPSTGARGGEVELASGETVPYKFLVLAPGSIWPGVSDFPIGDRAQLVQYVNDWRKRFKDAKSVIIVGGGAVGIELAGEIKDTYPKTKVTIVHGGKQLMNDVYPAKFRKNLEKKMKARGVELLLGEFVTDTVEEGTTGEVKTRSGKVLTADIITSAAGPRPNTSFLQPSSSPSLNAETTALTDRGFIKILPTLQLTSHPSIFAAGDAMDWEEQKQAGKTMGHVPVIVANILSMIQGTEPKQQYKKATEMILVTNGKASGATYMDILWGVMLGGWVSAKLKSKDLFVTMSRKQMGYDV